MTPQERAARQRRANGAGLLSFIEPAATMLSGIGAQAVSGAAALPTLFMGNDERSGVDTYVDAQRKMQESMTYQPRSAEGQKGLLGFAETMAPVGSAIESGQRYLGDREMNNMPDGSPVWAKAIAGTLGYMAPDLLGVALGAGPLLSAAKNLSRKAGVPEFGADVSQFKKPGLAKELGVVAGRKAKKLNPAAVALADSMKAGGSSAAEIREATKALGTPIWFDTDGSLRWEIDDSGMIVNRDADGTAFSDRVSHPELFDNYPEAKDIRMNDDWGMGTTGSYDEAMNVISFNSQQPRFDLKKLLAHEVNHGVQGIEGFARGGSPSEFKAYPQSFISEFQTNQMPRLVELEGKANLTNLERHELRKLSRVRDNMVEYAEKSQGGRLSPFEMYKRKLGEADSRAVEDRIGMTKQQRDEVEFNESHDVPAEEITRDYFGGQPSLSADNLLGIKKEATPGRVVNETKANQGYSVNALTGAKPDSGYMMGKYANNDPRNTVTEGLLGRGDVKDFYDKNNKALRRDDTFMGTWFDGDNTYLDVSDRYDSLRQATKAGEKTGQIAGWDVLGLKETPVGDWNKFIRSDEYAARTKELAKDGKKYLSQHDTEQWWDMYGTMFEDVYGNENMPQLAGFIASTAPNTNPTMNLRNASEYMRRHIKGEETIQPDFRIPADAVHRTPGVRIGMEAGRVDNLNKSRSGLLGELQSDKVREEAAALMGDPNAVVLDRWWARISEKPRDGIFTGAEEGKYPGNTKTHSLYQENADEIRRIAKEAGEDPRNFSADAWTGARERVKGGDGLFGEKYTPSAVEGESKAYVEIFSDLLKEKAKHLKISVEEMKARLRAGDSELLSTLGLEAGMVATLLDDEED